MLIDLAKAKRRWTEKKSVHVEKMKKLNTKDPREQKIFTPLRVGLPPTPQVYFGP